MYVIGWTCVLLTHTAQCHVSTFQYFYLTAVVSQRQSWSSWLLPPVRTCFSISSRKSGLMRTCMGMRVPEIKAEVIPVQIRGRKIAVCVLEGSRVDRINTGWIACRADDTAAVVIKIHTSFFMREIMNYHSTRTSVYTVHSLHGLRMFIV